MTCKSHHEHDNQIPLLCRWVHGLITGIKSLHMFSQSMKMFCEKLHFLFYFSGHFEWLEANDNALYKSTYLNSSVCHCSSKSCRFQFHYSMADSSVLKAVLFTDQVRSNTDSFSKSKDTAAQVLPAKRQGRMPASTCLHPKFVHNSNLVPSH